MTTGFESTLAVGLLPTPVTAVLLSAFELADERGAPGLDDRLTTHSAHRVLEIIEGYAPLRKHLRTDLRIDESHPDGELAAQLIDADPQTAGAAARKIRKLLDQAKTQARNARRTDRRAARPTAEERTVNREQERISRIKGQRDKALSRADAAELDRERQFDLNADLQSELETARARLVATEQQLASLRSSLTELPVAAQLLADVLTPRVDDHDVVQTPRDEQEPESPISIAVREAALRSLTGALDPAALAGVAEWLPRLLSAVAQPPRLEAFTELQLTVDVLGGGAEVGGSCVLVTAGGTRILIDCGTRPSGVDEQSMAPPGIERALAGPIDAIVVTHAHNDHGGWVPAVLAKQPRVPVLATTATCDLLATMWNDSAKVMKDQVGTGRWQGGALPPYSQADVYAALDRLDPVACDRARQVGALTIELFDAGHIVGAAGVVVTAGERRVVVTGDVSTTGQATVGGFKPIASAHAADLVLLESTYAGQRGADPRQQVVKDFVRSVTATLDAGGIALVPSFALGRAQEVALICAEYLPDVEVLVDGLARDITETYERYDGPKGGPLRIFGGNVRAVERGKTIDEKIRLKTGVVIATSGMLSSGPAVTWAQRVLPDSRSALLLVGYQDPQSPGGRLLELAGPSGRGGRFSLPNRYGAPDDVEVLARVDSFHLGAHANEPELVSIADRLRPGRLMLVHGEAAKQQGLAGKLLQRGHRPVPATEVWQAGEVTEARMPAN
ncbi:MBL fold metallo-hydrolase [Kribbella sp. NPDC056861]|uniref:MBL fold metallo-hydrolase n=1 Tax=Kribbella sp. NPDC056861 TaxID=3154857 RepID=UPI003417B4C4